MVRKSKARTAASSAAAAAANPSTPAFTSFAAATAHALGDASSTTPSQFSPWDSQSLLLLKKLSKRDTTTKLRALADISSHIHALPDHTPGLGAHFVTAWGPAFRVAVVEDDSAAVRAATLQLMSLVVGTFRKLVQRILPTVLPVWIAAMGDESGIVSDAARSTLGETLTTAVQREKVVKRYGNELRKFIRELVLVLKGGVDKRQFEVDAKRIIAVLRWLVEADRSCEVVGEVIDAEDDPLVFLAKGSKRKGGKKEREGWGALKEVCEFAVKALAYMTLRHEADEKRAKTFMQIALLSIRKGESAGWDLVLVLLSGGWHHTFDMDKFGDTVAEAVTAKFPKGLVALLPVFNALPHENKDSAVFAGRVLERMSRVICPKEGTRTEKSIGNVGFVLTSLQTYLECASFALVAGSKRWLGGDPTRSADFSSSVVEGHIVPIASLFLAGKLPPVPRMQEVHGLSKKPPVGAYWKSYGEFATTLARSLQMIPKNQWQISIQTLGEAILKGVEANGYQSTYRFEALFDRLNDVSFGVSLIVAIVTALIALGNDRTMKHEVQLLALSLSKPISRNVLHCDSDSDKKPGDIIQGLLSLANRALAQQKGQVEGLDKDRFVKDTAEVYSWIHWACHSQILHEINIDVVEQIEKRLEKQELWQLMGAFLRAHKSRKLVAAFSPWKLIHGSGVNRIILNATNNLRRGEIQACDLVRTAVDPEGGADIPLEILKGVAEALRMNIESDESDETCDEVIIALLGSPVQYMEPQETFKNFFSWTVLRAARNQDVFSSMVAILEVLPERAAEDRVAGILDLLNTKRQSSQFSESEYQERALVAAKIIAALHVQCGVNCTALCDKVLSWSSGHFTVELLSNVPLSAVFGDGPNLSARHDRVLHVIGAVQNTAFESHVFILLESFLRSLNDDERGRLARHATKKYLSGSFENAGKVIQMVSQCLSEQETDTATVAPLIADCVAEVVSNAKIGFKRDELRRIAGLMSILDSTRHNEFLDSFQSPFEELVRCIRRDPLSEIAADALEILSASLRDFRDFEVEKGKIQLKGRRSVWLGEGTCLALTSVRKFLERPLSAPTSRLQSLEARASLLMSRAVVSLGVASVDETDIRFWALRTRDILQPYVGKVIPKSKSTLCEASRLTSTATLGSVLVNCREVSTLIKPELLLEICHFGAWATVSMLPVVETLTNNAAVSAGSSDLNSDGGCDLVVKAAEKGVLVGPDGRIPVGANLVYSLVPHLASQKRLTRNATLTLLAFTANIELPTTIAKAFPKNGFRDEKQELTFVTKVIPEPLRKALQWPAGIGDQEDSEVKGISATEEVGFFLAWRLFLDLIGSNEEAASESSLLRDVEEDISFRRVGTTFLKSNPELYSHFFNKCVEVVVDGNTNERSAAGAAAAEALEAEERVAQGIQLVREQIEKEEREKKMTESTDSCVANETGMGVDEEVGRAAGIAFARALQRLPALSRQHVLDKLDRGSAIRAEEFVRKKISPLLIAAEIRKIKEWGAFGGGKSSGMISGPSATKDGGDSEGGEGELHAVGSVAGKLVRATYTFSDVTLEIWMRLPDAFPLQIVEVEAKSRIGMSESRWRKTLLGMTRLLSVKDGSLAEAVELWRRNLDRTFQGAEECPICYSVLHLATAALPKMQCRTCKNLFHSDCLCRWFTTSNSSACPLCRSAF
eukprot:GFKZ01001686.1.p1 GENE.GFKZ01001686.1~~GFKZ01001686.1.p1  ORF type:complete len:1676 (+),score=258.06 GFKZ01001686.1:174-5201(+)